MIRVLIAEDEPPIARSIQAMIERLDDAFQVTGIAGDGEQALTMMEEQPADVVLTDIRMPMMDGLSLLDHLQRRWPALLMVVISGYGTFEYSAQALRSHAFDYLLKPVSESAMRELLKRLKLEHQRRRRARLERLLTSELNRAPEAAPEDDLDGDEQRMLVALMRAASADYWDQLNLEALISDLLGTLDSFIWVFMGDTPEQRVVMLEIRPGMLELMEYVHEYMQDRVPGPVACACMNEGVALAEMRAALTHLADALRREGSDSGFLLVGGGEQPDAAHALAGRVREYIDANYTRHITNQTLSEQFGYVPSYMSLLFRRRFEESPSEYLTRVRLERAKQLMRQDQHVMVKDVAEQVGFKNQYHFSKAFKKHTGQWPSDYKDGGTKQ